MNTKRKGMKKQTCKLGDKNIEKRRQRNLLEVLVTKYYRKNGIFWFSFHTFRSGVTNVLHWHFFLPFITFYLFFFSISFFGFLFLFVLTCFIFFRVCLFSFSLSLLVHFFKGSEQLRARRWLVASRISTTTRLAKESCHDFGDLHDSELGKGELCRGLAQH